MFNDMSVVVLAACGCISICGSTVDICEADDFSRH